ncbi:MAG TPA: ADP-ribosylation factor-like protein [Candidatus Lokiarchaeia archaeon]
MVKKIAFLGLDNAGKTSIITAIRKRFGFEEEIMNLTPTRRIDRDSFRFLGIEFIRLDFGGQIQYREDYLKTPDKYLSATDMLFYVVDSQDYNRYIEAIDYLDNLILYFKESQNYLPISILFHKYDPEIMITYPEISKKIVVLKQALMKYSETFDIFFFETSIYDIKSIMDAFSSGLSLLFDKMELMSQLFSEIGKNYNAILIDLFDSRGITIGEYYRPHLHLQEKMKIYNVYIKVQKRIVNEDRTILEFSDTFDSGDRFSGVVEVLNFGSIDFYLLFIIEEEENLEKTIDILDKIEAAKPQIENLILQIIQ